MGFAFLLLMSLAILVAVADAWILRGNSAPVRGLGEVIRDQLSVVAGRVNAGHLGAGLLALITLPARMFQEHPGLTMLLAVPAAVSGAVFGGAISRTASTEFARRERTPWIEAIVLSARKGWTQALATVLPLVLISVAAAGVAVVGKVMLGFATTSPLGGVLFGAQVLACTSITLALCVFLLALPMLTPAVLAEGTDSIDSIQRSAAYVVAQPVRYLAYAIILVAQILLFTAILAALIRAAFVLTGALSAMFLPDPYAALVRQSSAFGTLPTLGLDAGEYPRWQARSGELIVFWRRVLVFAVPASYAVSSFYTAGAALYLAMRRLCDGQDPAELWNPGDDESTSPRAFTSEGGDDL